jgi:hypothetical protein
MDTVVVGRVARLLCYVCLCIEPVPRRCLAHGGTMAPVGWVYLRSPPSPTMGTLPEAVTVQVFQRAPGPHTTADQLQVEVDPHGVKRCGPVPRLGKK